MEIKEVSKQIKYFHKSKIRSLNRVITIITLEYSKERKRVKSEEQKKRIIQVEFGDKSVNKSLSQSKHN